LLDRGDVHENVLTAIIANDEAETLLAVEELNDALAFADDLGRHAAATTAAAETAAAASRTEPAATATAAEAITAAKAAAAAEAITAAAEAAATEAVTAAKAATAAKIIAAEAVALVFAAALTALTSIETHALQFFPHLAPNRRRAMCRAQHISLSARKNKPRLRNAIKQKALPCERFWWIVEVDAGETCVESGPYGAM